MIVIRARAIKVDGRLPVEISNECCLVAVYLLNRTPVEPLGWKTPYKVVHGQKPSAAHLNVVGARAYVLNNQTPQQASQSVLDVLIGLFVSNVVAAFLLLACYCFRAACLQLACRLTRLDAKRLILYTITAGE
jgi:hypothetical protein